MRTTTFHPRLILTLIIMMVLGVTASAQLPAYKLDTANHVFDQGAPLKAGTPFFVSFPAGKDIDKVVLEVYGKGGHLDLKPNYSAKWTRGASSNPQIKVNYSLGGDKEYDFLFRYFSSEGQSNSFLAQTQRTNISNYIKKTAFFTSPEKIFMTSGETHVGRMNQIFRKGMRDTKVTGGPTFKGFSQSLGKDFDSIKELIKQKRALGPAARVQIDWFIYAKTNALEKKALAEVNKHFKHKIQGVAFEVLVPYYPVEGKGKGAPQPFVEKEKKEKTPKEKVEKEPKEKKEKTPKEKKEKTPKEKVEKEPKEKKEKTPKEKVEKEPKEKKEKTPKEKVEKEPKEKKEKTPKEKVEKEPKEKKEKEPKEKKEKEPKEKVEKEPKEKKEKIGFDPGAQGVPYWKGISLNLGPAAFITSAPITDLNLGTGFMVGASFPFAKPMSDSRFLSNVTGSIGVLVSNAKDFEGTTFNGKPVFFGLGIPFLKVLRLQAGGAVLSMTDIETTVKSTKFNPYIGLGLDISLFKLEQITGKYKN